MITATVALERIQKRMQEGRERMDKYIAQTDAILRKYNGPSPERAEELKPVMKQREREIDSLWRYRLEAEQILHWKCLNERQRGAINAIRDGAGDYELPWHHQDL